MKKTRPLNFAAGLLGACLWASTVHAVEARSWVSENEGTVYWLPAPELKIDLLISSSGDDEFYSQLSVELEGSSASITSQLRNVAEQHPGFKYQQIEADMVGAWRLDIPTIGRSIALAPQKSPTGLPYAAYGSFLSKSETDKLVAALKAQPAQAIAVSGSLMASVPMRSVVDEIKIGPLVCQEILPRTSATLFEVMTSFRAVASRIDTLGRLPETRTQLKKTVLAGCLHIPPNAVVKSFDELLSLSVSRIEATQEFTSTTWRTVSNKQTLPLTYMPVVSIKSASGETQ